MMPEFMQYACTWWGTLLAGVVTVVGVIALGLLGGVLLAMLLQRVVGPALQPLWHKMTREDGWGNRELKVSYGVRRTGRIAGKSFVVLFFAGIVLLWCYLAGSKIVEQICGGG